MHETNPDVRDMLRSATSSDHARLDQRIAEAGAFASLSRYGALTRAHHALFRAVAGHYRHPALDAAIPGFADRDRTEAAARDLADLGLSPSPEEAEAPAADADLPAALGALYVAEGARLGAAILFRQAQALGLGAAFGARHLAPADAGVAAGWREFVGMLNAVPLSAAELDRAVTAARDAFALAGRLVERELGDQSSG